ncbi:MAG: hypothetical protein LBI72_00700 [Flavobacteriaceae bacterium]|nr:hypothetical protein [Flavobacteriaceae bacterium]
MGFNIAGLVINKNYQHNIGDLEQVLNQNLVLEGEVDFESGSENWKEDDYCDVYFTDRGTLVFLSMEAAAFEFLVANQNAMSFVLSEMSMTFSINYTRNKFLVRQIVESEGELVDNKGEVFDFEEYESDKSELIYYLIEQELGIRFWDIDLDEKCFRYRLEPYTVKEIEIDKKDQTISVINSTAEITKVKKQKTSLFNKVLGSFKRK